MDRKVSLFALSERKLFLCTFIHTHLQAPSGTFGQKREVLHLIYSALLSNSS